MRRFIKNCIVCIIALLAFSCSEINDLKTAFKDTPHTQYKESLDRAGLVKTAMGRQWVAESKSALQESVKVPLPYQETGYFNPSLVRADGLQFELKEGEKIKISIESDSLDASNLFMDLYAIKADKDAKLVANADKDSLYLEFEAGDAGTFLLRVQPELLVEGKYKLSLQKESVYAFPVIGKDDKAIGSFMGAPRDGGKRRHEGIDIFAPKGTPVIAGVKGVVSRVTKNKLGGKVVFITDIERRQSVYFAHLDSQLVEPGQLVSVNDTIGLVGNTGNAKFTPPHLHIGIYKWSKGGAIDPLPFISTSREKPEQAKAPISAEVVVKKTSKKTELISSPSKKPNSKTTVPRNTVVTIMGATAEYYKVKTTEGAFGFIPYKDLADPIVF